MPYSAARALAANFCWHIRYALTPLFGDDFIHECQHPQSPKYKDWAIDRGIVKDCELELIGWNPYGRDPSRQPSNSLSPPPIGYPDRPMKLRPRSTLGTPFEDESAREGTTDTRTSASLNKTPTPGVQSDWTSMNSTTTPSHARSSNASSPLRWFRSGTSSSSERLGSPATKRSKRNTGAVKYTAPKRQVIRKRKVGSYDESEIAAANALVQLSMQDSRLPK